ncbi:hypothetical protein MRX96_000208 [Rhipicephalus microplus]
MWRGRISPATSGLFTRIPAQQPAILSHACCQHELVGVLALSCCVSELDVAEPRFDSSARVAVAALRVCTVRQTKRSNISSVECPGYANISRRLFIAHAQLGLPHVTVVMAFYKTMRPCLPQLPEDVLGPRKYCSLKSKTSVNEAERIVKCDPR